MLGLVSRSIDIEKNRASADVDGKKAEKLTLDGLSVTVSGPAVTLKFKNEGIRLV
jgi:hypothetical protein